MKQKHQKSANNSYINWTYFASHNIFLLSLYEKNKFTDNQVVQKMDRIHQILIKVHSFENVQYEGLYQINKTFSVMSEKAHILNKEPDIVYMTNMHVILYLRQRKNSKYFVKQREI